MLAAVRTAPRTTELREFPMPEIPADSALMKMEVAGICGTDVKLYKTPPSDAPVIMGSGLRSYGVSWDGARRPGFRSARRANALRRPWRAARGPGQCRP